MEKLNYIKTIGTATGDTELIFKLVSFRHQNPVTGKFIKLTEDHIWGANRFEDSLAEEFQWYGLDSYQEKVLNDFFNKNNREEAVIRFNYVELIPSSDGNIKNKKDLVLKFKRFIDGIYVDLREGSVAGELVTC